MTGIVELIEERRRTALQELHEGLCRDSAQAAVEALHRNLRDVADDPEDFPEPESRAPYGLKYWMTN